MFNGANQYLPSSASRSVKEETREYRTDFSDKFEKAKNKVLYVSSLSILVGLYEFDQSSSFLGLKLSGLTDNRLEWIIWAAGIFFVLNMLMRFGDERRVFEEYKNSVARFRNEFFDIISELNTATRNLEELLQSKNGIIDGSISAFEKSVMDIREIIERKGFDPEVKTQILNKLNSTQKSILDVCGEIKERSINSLDKIDRLPIAIRNFSEKNKPVQRFVGLGRIRFLIFDFIIPISLFFIATLVHFFPAIQNSILDIIQ